MIYLFSDSVNMLDSQPVIPSEIILENEVTKELNGFNSVYIEYVAGEVDVSEAKYVVFMDSNNNFQMYKILSKGTKGSVSYIEGVHKFLDDLKASDFFIEFEKTDVEPKVMIESALSGTKWVLDNSDTFPSGNISLEEVSPLEVLEEVLKKFPIEIDYWIEFDSNSIVSQRYALKSSLGVRKNKFYEYGSNVLNIEVEHNTSEIYTAAIGLGATIENEGNAPQEKEVRIDFSDVVWSKSSGNPLNKPKGSNMLVDDQATIKHGYFENGKYKPRITYVVFDEIKDPKELIKETHKWLVFQTLPKAVYRVEVFEGENVDLGDEVAVRYADIGVSKWTKVSMTKENLIAGKKDIYFGDVGYFNSNTANNKIEGEIDTLKKSYKKYSRRIYELKVAFDKEFADRVTAIENEFQLKLDTVKNEIQADKEAFELRYNADKEALSGEIQDSYTNAVAEANRIVEAKETDFKNYADGIGSAANGRIDDLYSGLGDLSSEFESLEIGGRNLLPAFTNNRWTHTNQTEVEDYSIYFPSGHIGNSIIFIDVEKQTNYTMTFNSDYARYYIYEVLEDESLGRIIRTRTGSETHTFNTEDISRIRISLNTFSGNVQEEKNIWNLKLERGTKATDWTPAPEDVDQKLINANKLIEENKNSIATANQSITSAEQKIEDASKTLIEHGSSINSQAVTIENIENTLSTKVSQSELDSVKGTVTEHDTSIKQNAEKILTKADSSTVDTLSKTVTTHGTALTQTAKELSTKANQSEVNTLKGIVTEHGTSITQNANEIASKADSSVVNELKETVTKHGTSITQNAEEIQSKADSTELNALKGTVTTQGTLLKQTAEELSSKADKNVVDTLTGRVSSTESSVTQNAEEINKRVSKVVYDTDKKATDSKISTLTQENTQLKLDTSAVQLQANKIQESTDSLTKDLASLTIKNNEVTTKVGSITDELGETKQQLAQTTTKANSVETTVTNMLNGKATKGTVFQNTVDGFLNRVWQTDIDNLEIGGRNLSVKTLERNSPSRNTGTSSDNFNYVAYYTTEPIQSGKDYTIHGFVEIVDGDFDAVTVYEYPSGRKSDVELGENGYFCTTIRAKGEGADRFLIYNGLSGSTRGNGVIFRKVKIEKGSKPTDWSPAPEDLMKYTDIAAKPDGFLIGSFEMGGDKIAQAIVGKAGAIDLIADNVNFTGNVNVAKQIKAYSLEAVYADISKLRTNILTANSVTSNALKVDTALIKKLNTNSILTNYLIANTAMIENIKSKSLEAVYANISELRTRLLVANVITADMVKFDTALIEKFTSSTAFINSLTAKSAFISNVKAIDIDFDRATARAGDSTTYLTITGNRITQRGQFRRQWRNTWYDYDVGTILREGYLKFADYNRNREISISAFGISTFLDGSGNDAGFAGSSGTISWWDKTYGSADGITMSSHVGVAALRSFMNRVVLEAESTVDLYSNSSTIYLNPHTQTYGGTNRFMFTIGRDPNNENHVVGYQMYGANTSDVGFGVGLRFDKTRATPKIRVVNEFYATSSSTTFEVGSIETEVVKPRPGQERLDIYSENAMNLYYTSNGDFGVRSGYIYNSTYSNAANLFISNGRVLGRSTSASKYKLAIEKQFENDKEQYEYSKRILDLDVKTWFDRRESEIYADELTKGERISDDEFYIKRHAGLIAEDVYEVGLDEHVSYGADGEIEGIAYDRLWIHLLPIVKKQNDRINELENKLNKIMEMIA